MRLNEPPVATTDFVELAPGGELSVTADRLAGLVPGTASIQVGASGAGRLNVPAILRALDRYPYGCTEQITSRAMPLVYLNDVAIRAGLAGDPDIRDRVEKAVAGVLANQSAAGSFGLWAPGSEDMWLDAYVTDFLTRARQKGYAVPARGVRPRARQSEEQARLCQRLHSRAARTSPMRSTCSPRTAAPRSATSATTPRPSSTPSRRRSPRRRSARRSRSTATSRAPTRCSAPRSERSATRTDATSGWRSDYGSDLRDSAATLTLASETRAGIDLVSLSSRVEDERLHVPTRARRRTRGR